MKKEKKMILKKVVEGLIWQDKKGKFYFAVGKTEVGVKKGRFLPLKLPLIEKEKIGGKR